MNSVVDANFQSSFEQTSERGENQPNAHWNNTGSGLDLQSMDMTSQEFALLQPTNQIQIDQSNVDVVADTIEANELPIPKEEFQLPLIDGDCSEEAAQWRKPGQAASSPLLAAHHEQAVPKARRKSLKTERKPTKTYSETIGCNVPIEPMIIHSINIQNEVSIVDNCDTDRVKQLCGTSGQQPNAVDEHQTDLGAKQKRVRGRKKLKSDDKSKKDNAETRLFICYICQEACSSKSLLKKHIREHTGEKPYECQVCKKTYPRPDYLQIHFIRHHSGQKPYECHVCKKTFKDLRELKKHRRIHLTDEKPCECQECKKIFSPKRKSRSKTHECQVCKKTFYHLCNLKAHSAIHSSHSIIN